MSSFQAERDNLFGNASPRKKAQALNPKNQDSKSSGSKSSAEKQAQQSPLSVAVTNPKPPTEMQLRAKAEADDFAAQAVKLMIKPRFSMFWSAEPMKAGRLYEKAGHKLRGASFTTEAKVMYEEAAKCQEMEGFNAKASTFWRLAADLAVESGDVHAGLALYRKTADALGQIGQISRAVDARVVGTKALLKAGEDDAAMEEYLSVCTLILADADQINDVELGPRDHEIFLETMQWLIRTERFSAARSLMHRCIAVLRKNDITNELHKAYLTQVILELHEGDGVRANELFMNHLGDSEYLRTNQCKVEEELVLGIKNNDAASLATGLEGLKRAFLQKDVEELARSLRVEEIAEIEDEEEDTNVVTVKESEVENEDEEIDDEELL